MRIDDFESYKEPIDLCQALGIHDTTRIDEELERLDRYYKAKDEATIDEAKDFIFSELDGGADNDVCLALMVYFRRAISRFFWSSRLPKNWRDFPKYRNSLQSVWIDWLDYIFNFIKSGLSTPPSFGLDPDRIEDTPLRALVNRWSFAFQEFGRRLIWEDSGKKDLNDPGTTSFSDFEDDDSEGRGGFESSKFVSTVDDDVADLSVVEDFIKDLKTNHNEPVHINKNKETACTPWELFKVLMNVTIEYMSAISQNANGANVKAKKPSVKSLADEMGITEPDVFFCKQELVKVAAEYDISSEQMVSYAASHIL